MKSNVREKLQFLVIGGGSIGKRHAQNLLSLGQDVWVTDNEPVKEKELPEQVKGFYRDFKEALNACSWDGVLICTPTGSHLDFALKVAEKKIPLFIEKPLSHSLERVETLKELVKNASIPLLVGCNMRFHPCIVRTKELLGEKDWGKWFGIQIEFGQYLPDWHPWEDYRQGYSARKDLGGGIVLDAIHEIDLLFLLAGVPNEVYAVGGKSGIIETETEDFVDVIFSFKKGLKGYLHLDYLQRDYSRWGRILAENGTIEWDIAKAEIRYFDVQTSKWICETFPSYDSNKMYIEEMKHFINCIRAGEKPVLDINGALMDLESALNIKKVMGWV